jgi:protein-tyrosine phosphatase
MRVLFVCTGNICRSPTAEGVFLKMVADAGLAGEITIDSAGTHDYHVGDAPDPRSVEAAARRGYDLVPLRARQVSRRDFDDFDLILAMDEGHRAHLVRLCPPSRAAAIKPLMAYATQLTGEDVPDPYYGGEQGFEDVLDMIEDASRGLLEAVRAELVARKR